MSDALSIKAEVVAINRKLDFVISSLDDRRQPNLSQAEFARRSKLSRATVSRMVGDGRLKASRGRVLFSELSKFTS